MLKKSFTFGIKKSASNSIGGSEASPLQLLADFFMSDKEGWDNASRYVKPTSLTLEETQAHLQKIKEIKPQVDDLLYRKSRNEWFWSELVEELYFQTAKHHALLKKLSIPKNKSSATSVSEEEILRAKQFPLTSLLAFKRLTMCCPFHNERTPSLYFYPQTNSAYCFGACGRSYDSIEVYKLQHNCTFVQAVKSLQ